MRSSLDQRFARRVQVDPGGCWMWLGRANSSGYGRIFIEGRLLYAHRVAYELFVGPIPAGMHIDHLCRNKTCVNPEHLEPVTLAENVLRGDGAPARNARKTHCLRGHPLSGANLKIKSAGRVCRTCARQSKEKTPS